MIKFRTILQALTLVIGTLAFASMAQAQATRTWVSGVGDDVNPCSRTAPCKTFAGAISKTADKGEIDALDPGGFGTVTITKNITIDGQGTMASILAAGTNGVNINDSATATPNSIIVTLRNLSINGAGTGFDGIRFTFGKVLYVENCVVFNFKGNGLNSDGLDIAVGNAAVTFAVHVKDSFFENNTGDGIRQTISAGTLNASYDNVALNGNVNGLEATGGTGNISRSVVDNNSSNGITVSGGSIVNANGNSITSNTTNGINCVAPSTVRIGNNFIHRNGTGLAGAGTYNSFGNNNILGNTSDGVTPPVTNPK